MRNIFRLKKEKKITKKGNYFKYEEENYEPVRLNNFWNSNYVEYNVEYKINSDENKKLSMKMYLNIIYQKL